MAKSKSDKYSLKQLGVDLQSAIIDLAGFVGLSDLANNLFSKTGNWQAEIINDSTKLGKINSLLSQVANKYNIDYNKVLDEFNSLTGIPRSALTTKAKAQHKNKLRNEIAELTKQYDADTKALQSAYGAQSAISSATNSAARRSEAYKTASDAVDRTINTIERRISNVQK